VQVNNNRRMQIFRAANTAYTTPTLLTPTQRCIERNDKSIPSGIDMEKGPEVYMQTTSTG